MKIKRIISVLLCVVVMLTMIPCGASAASAGIYRTESQVRKILDSIITNEFKPGSYFTQNGKKCTSHTAAKGGCNNCKLEFILKRTDVKNAVKNAGISSGNFYKYCWTCQAFASYCYTRCFNVHGMGTVNGIEASKYYTTIGKVTDKKASSVKELMLKAKAGDLIYVNNGYDENGYAISPHWYVVYSVSASGVLALDNNGNAPNKGNGPIGTVRKSTVSFKTIAQKKNVILRRSDYLTASGGTEPGTTPPPVTPPAPVNAVSKWTLSVSGITTNSATVRADITCTPSKLSKVGLELGTSSGNMKSVVNWNVGNVLTYCTVKCDGSEGPKLSHGTTYYYRFYVLRTDGKYEYSSTGNFTTKSNTCTNHTYDKGTVTTAATCTAAGTIVYKCTKCGASKTETVKAKGHTAGSWTVTKQPQVGVKGTETQKCTVCSAVLATREIAALAPSNAVTKWTLSVSGITETSATVRADITCTPSKLSKVGLELGTSSGNMKSVASWKVGTILTFCSVKCDGSEGPKLSPGTTYYYRFYVQRTDGKYEYSTTGNFTTKSNACTSHTYGSGTVTVNPTCTAAGTIVYKCTKCGASKTEAVNAKGHTAQVLPGKAATCTAPGLSEGSKCSVCNAVIKAQTTIPAKGHSVQALPGKAATCTAPGLTEGSKCSVCNAVIKAQTAIPAKGHSVQTLPGKAATCTAPGLSEGSKCSVCNAVIKAQTTIPAKGHSVQTLPGKAATCTAPGLTEGSKCSVCNAVIKAQTAVPAKGHSVQTLPGKAATCTAPGLTEGSKCSVCNAVIKAQTAIPAKGHKAGAWTVTKQPQVGVKGTETQKCTVCSAVLATREIAALSSFLPGDVDRDGQITATDARLVLRIAVALDRVNAEVYRIADFNGDGTVTADDARSVLRRAVGLS